MYKNTKLLQKDCKKGAIYEFIRQILASKGEFQYLFNTYDTQKTFLPDSNTPLFWDERFASKNSLFPMEQWRLKLVSKLINPKKSILHLGCGSGSLEEILVNSYGENLNLISTDITDETLNKLKNKYQKVQFYKTKLDSLPFASNKFDQVVMLEVLEHIRPNKTFPILREIYRVLRNDGILILSIPINEGLEKMLPNNPNSHMRIYSMEVIKFELNHVGFKIKKIYTASAFSRFFFVKHFINGYFHLRKPNNLVILATKIK